MSTRDVVRVPPHVLAQIRDAIALLQEDREAYRSGVAVNGGVYGSDRALLERYDRAIDALRGLVG